VSFEPFKDRLLFWIKTKAIMESFVDASCKLLLDGIDRVLQQVSARYDLNVDEVRREFLLPLMDQVPAMSGVRFFAPRTAAKPVVTEVPPPKPPKPEGPKCVARTIRGMCTRVASKPCCLCTLHFRLSTGPAQAAPVPNAVVPEEPVVVATAVDPEEPVEVATAVVPEEPVNVQCHEEHVEVRSSQSSFDVGDILEDVDFHAAFEDALRLPLPYPQPKKLPIEFVTSPQPKTIQEILASYQKIVFPKPTDAFMAEYGGITEVDKRTQEAIQKEQAKKIKIKFPKKVTAA